VVRVHTKGVTLRSRGLNPKHLKALELLKQGKLSVTEVAKKSGMGQSQLYDLLVGDEKAGPVAQEFSAIYNKVMEDADKRINAKQKELKDIVTSVLVRWSKEHQNKKLTESEHKGFVNTAKVLQTGPVYNIGSVSYSRGMNPEEMLNEFKRLRATAEGALDRRTVLNPTSEGAGILSAPTGRGVEAEEGSETPSLSA
jgi:transposase-like protein